MALVRSTGRATHFRCAGSPLKIHGVFATPQKIFNLQLRRIPRIGLGQACSKKYGTRSIFRHSMAGVTNLWRTVGALHEDQQSRYEVQLQCSCNFNRSTCVSRSV